MKIRSFAWILLFPIFLASLVELGIVLKLDELNEDIYHITSQRRGMRKFADEMRMTSEFLTRFARRYAITKEQKYLDWYNQIIDIRNGTHLRPKSYGPMYWDLVAVNIIEAPDKKAEKGKPLTELFTEVSFSSIANQKIIEAKTNSDDLARIERIAFHAMNGEFDDGTSNFAIKRKPDQQFASKILNNDSYLSAKARVVKPISDVLEIIDQESKDKIDVLEKMSRYLTDLQVVISACLISWVVLGSSYFYFRIVQRLVKLDDAVSLIGKGNFGFKSNVNGEDEIGKIGHTLEQMAANLDSSFGEMENKAITMEELSRELEKERDQTEKLLYNILPAVIASRIRNGEEMIAETFPEVTVLFADIVGFTRLSSNLGPHQTVAMLNDIFGRFDALTEKYQIEKIKTMGDCYMAVGGVPTRDPLHCQHIADFAIDVLNSIQEYGKDLPFELKIRVGIHTGTVAAGIVGKRKFSYDLWGDVVNIANRYEATSHPDKIHVSEAIKIRLDDDYTFMDGGMVELKGKGVAKSYFLIGKKADMPQVIQFKKASLESENHLGE